MVTENYAKIEERVEAACKRAGRERKSVTVIAVSKTKPDEMVVELAGAGVKDFGENKPQELKRKHDGILSTQDADGNITTPLKWHMIGNLQTNKVKMVVGRACLIHSVQSIHLAQAISDQARKSGLIVPILIEINIADEETKYGANASETEALVRSAAALPGLKVMGLMAIAPPVEDPEDNRKYFRRLREMRDELRSKNIENAPMTELSMGMTGDFEVAVEEGATYIRVGTAIFGERTYA